LSAPIHGFLNLNKPAGYTSHDVVALVRRLCGVRRAGHAGTLDPLATGVLPVCLGRATRLADLVGEGEKEYRAEVTLGVTTATDDAEGEPLLRRPLPAGLTRASLEEVLAAFVGTIEQVPPAFSARRQAGVRAYALARAGQEVRLPPRPVTIYSIALEELALPRLWLRVRCSRGTYIRALARDLGEALGCGAHLSGLVRTRVGVFTLADAVTLEQLREAAGEGRWSELLLPPDFALQHLPRLVVEPGRREDMRLGRQWPDDSGARAGLHAVYDVLGCFLGLAEPVAGRWQPRIAFVGEVE